MSSILLVESGSTKTDWCLLKRDSEVEHVKTSGINPYLQTQEEINAVLDKELPWQKDSHTADKIMYYGAGAGSEAKKRELANALKRFFGDMDIEVECDMMAAARAMCGNNQGIVSILGTGSNSCYYDGKSIVEKKASLGYIAGDEGSGNYLGKRVLQYYAYQTFDEELMMSFEQLFGNDISQIVNKLYREPFPNRYLATFVNLLKHNRGHYMVENIIEDCLNDFFHHHILKYRQSWNLPLYFTGSVSFEFADVIGALCNQYELELGKIEKSPIDGLIAYHKELLR